MFVADGAGDETDDGVGDGGGGDFASGEDVVAHADFFGDVVFADAVVDAFEVAAEDYDVAFEGEVVGHFLVELPAVGGDEDYFVVLALREELGQAAVDGFDFHHHAGEAAEWVVVDFAVFVGGIIVEIMEVDFCYSFFLCAGEYRVVEEAANHVGDDAYYVYSHFYFLFYCKCTKKHGAFR